jgi:hypothetical protein
MMVSIGRKRRNSSGVIEMQVKNELVARGFELGNRMVNVINIVINSKRNCRTK